MYVNVTCPHDMLVDSTKLIPAVTGEWKWHIKLVACLASFCFVSFHVACVENVTTAIKHRRSVK